MVFNVTRFYSRAMEERSGQEGRRHEAEAVTAGDADGGKRDAADPATGGIPTEPDAAHGRMRRVPYAARASVNAPKKAKLSEGRFGEAEPEGCANIRAE